VGYKRVRKGALIIVRHDDRRPSFYEAQYGAGPGEKEHVVEMNADEWGSLRPLLREVEDE
jgi:hypothetical protein